MLRVRQVSVVRHNGYGAWGQLQCLRRVAEDGFIASRRSGHWDYRTARASVAASSIRKPLALSDRPSAFDRELRADS